MAAITLHNVDKQFGGQIVLRNVSLELHKGRIAGLVGDNGTGKTTLLRIINRELTPDSGAVTHERGLETGFLTQEPDIRLDRTLHDEVGAAFDELLAIEHKLHQLSEQIAQRHDDPQLPELLAAYERANAQFIAVGGHTFETRLKQILGGLGFDPRDSDRPLHQFSGGQKCRAALAKLLHGEGTFLLLDEPTNHLDIDVTRWLEKFLSSHNGGALIVSHDRYLLDRLCDRILQVDQATVTSYNGNYTTYAQTRDVQILTQQRQFTKNADFIRKEREFIARHIAGQRTKEAQGRRTRLERRLRDSEFVTDAPTRKRTARIAFRDAAEQTGVIVRVDDVSMSFGDKRLFTDLRFQVHGRQRFGITGPNGCGKTTLLKIALGELDPTAGEVTIDPKLRVGYYGQEHYAIDPQRTIVDEIRADCPALDEPDTRSLLAQFLFTGDDAFKTLGSLSGGELSRVRLFKLILDNPDILFLDEPTNHLDIRSREALEDALKQFPGTIIVVSHDRYFLDRVIDRLLVMRPDGCKVYEGNYTFYAAGVEQQRQQRDSNPTPPKPVRDDTRPRKPKSAPSPYDRLSIDDLEEMLVARESELENLHERFGDPEVYKDLARLVDLQERVATLESEIAQLDAAWHDRADMQ